MPGGFVDTNVLVYANAVDNPRKQRQALDLLDRLVLDRDGAVSTQVLIEYVSVAFRKLHQDPIVVDEQVAYYASSMAVIVVDPGLIRRAIGLQARHRINYYDALILTAAESAGCEVLYSEDLNAGQSYSGIRVVNPFAA